ncbi:MAG: helicase-related protein [Gemmatimonadota bacterium]|nr:helicase-related protein [Gemmatimonadota bacterium]
MAGRPSLLDNLHADTGHGDGLVYLTKNLDDCHELSVATGYVNLGGLHHVAVSVDEDRATRLLLGTAPSSGLGGEFPGTLFERTLLALRKERDLARFPKSRALKKLLAIQDWLDRPNVDVRRYVKKFLHGKAYLFGDHIDARAALVTSANLTAAGMWQNLELGLVHYDPEIAKRAVNWFDALWEEASNYKDDLYDLLFPDVGLIDPRTVYLRALLELFGDQLDEDQELPQAVNLAPFQEDGFRRATSIVNRHRGVVFADGVGTGKTEIGLAFVEEYAVRRGQHVLVVVPAQLKDQWENRLNQSRLPAQVVSYQAFAADEQLANPEVTNRRRVLSSDKDAYRLIIFDEAHALRNPGTTWYGAMSRLLGGQEKALLLLTATPINNGLWDLYHMVMAFARHDQAFAAHGISSLRHLFLSAGANERDPENLNPDVLFPLADMVSVRRDRRFIESRYPGATFPDGTPVSFPTPHLTTERYDLDETYPNLVLEITTRISALKMARYRPSRYRRETAEEPGEAALSALLQSGILKRFESCWYACLLTVNRILAAHHAFLEAWDEGYTLGRETLREAAKAELDETATAQWLEERLDEGLAAESVDAYVRTFREDVEHDRDLLSGVQERLQKLDAESDPKLALFRRVLEESASQKVVVFSTFADTVEYLHDKLPKQVAGRQRVTVIGADTTPDVRTGLLSRFCPDTVVRPGYQPSDGEVDLLLSNDVLSEGQNLQQAAAVVSYDMPWNPQRMVQRYGRVIRLKSPHDEVYLTTMLPEQGDLEEILKLEIAIRRKIVAARPYGMEVQVIDKTEEEARAYAQRLVDGDTTLLDEDNEAGGTHEFSSEALRAELTRELDEGRGEELRGLPWGIGATFRQGPETPSFGAPGVFFACRAKGERYWRYVDHAGEVITAPASILRRIDPGLAPGVDDSPIDLEVAWAKAVASIVEEHNKEASGGSSESLGPMQRWGLELLADPTIAVPLGGAEAYEALGVGRSQPVRKALGEVKRLLDDEKITRGGAAKRIVNIVKMFGLRKVEKAPEKEEISADDVGVVCWMGVLSV